MALWIDVTSSYRWKGNAVGIIRTEREIVCRICKKADIRLMISRDSSWFEISVEDYLSKDSCAKGRQFPAEKEGRKLKIYFKKIILKYLKSLFNSYLAEIKAPTLEIVRALRVYARILNHFFKSKAFSIGLNIPSRTKKVTYPFVDGDALLFMGLDWDDKCLGCLRKIKKHVNLRIVQVCYDVIPYTHPQFVVPGYADILIEHFVNMAWGANFVLCISHSTQTEFVKFCKKENLPLPKTETFRMGVISNQNKGSLAKSLKANYCLSVSTVEPRKNYQLLYQVWEMLLGENPDETPLLVIVGRKGWSSDDLIHLIQNNPRTVDKIVFKENVSDSELMELYDGALFTLFPSFVEGWGLPVTESLDAGKFCIASNTSSLPESSQGLIESLSPYDTQLWFEKVRYYLQNPSIVIQKELEINEKFIRVTWEEAAVEFYEKIHKFLEQ